MKSELKRVLWCVAAGIVATTAISSWLESHRNGNAAKELEETRRTLRSQGFKTDFSNFDFQVDAAARARTEVLRLLNWRTLYNRRLQETDLLPEISHDSALVICKQDWVSGTVAPFDWSELHTLLDTNRDTLDSACAAVLSGPIRFEPKVAERENIWENHTPELTRMVVALSVRAMLELHDGSPDSAWTNLMAATRLVTAVEPDPLVSTHVYRVGLAQIAFSATWQALQCRDWPDTKLAILQQEWESANFLNKLPDTAAYSRVLYAYVSKRMAQEPFAPDFTFSDLAKETFQNPAQACSDVKDAFNLVSYRGSEQLKDEKDLLLYHRDRELELRHAIQSPTWSEMRAQPGVTNENSFKSWYPPLLDLMSFEDHYRRSMLAGAANTEAGRRVIITAIALERYRLERGGYPATLAALAPEFLNSVPVDFMNGQPLHYRLTEDGHFILYSVGLDCVDNGGNMPMHKIGMLPSYKVHAWFGTTNEDIVWPRPDFGASH